MDAGYKLLVDLVATNPRAPDVWVVGPSAINVSLVAGTQIVSRPGNPWLHVDQILEPVAFLEVTGDGYPSVEAYWDRGGQTITAIQDREGPTVGGVPVALDPDVSESDLFDTRWRGEQGDGRSDGCSPEMVAGPVAGRGEHGAVRVSVYPGSVYSDSFVVAWVKLFLFASAPFWLAVLMLWRVNRRRTPALRSLIAEIPGVVQAAVFVQYWQAAVLVLTLRVVDGVLLCWLARCQPAGGEAE
ncbi:MAG: hypothetical protein R2705_01325 [Ilumatobacteraceae bacterium]